MTVEIIVPPLSQTMDSLILVGWLKQPGDTVSKGEPLFTVETDKATLEVESPASGQLQAVTAQPGDEIRVRSVIGTIALSGEAGLGDIGQMPAAAAFTQLPYEPQKRLFATPRARLVAQQGDLDLEILRGQGSGPQGWVVSRDVHSYLQQKADTDQPVKSLKATPLARRVAQDTGIDLSTLTPGKPGESLRKADVEKALAAQTMPGVDPIKRIPLSPTRRTIARRLAESHSSVVPVTYMTEVDATRLVRLRKRLLEELPADAVRPTITDYLVMITCRVLSLHPELNATFDGEFIETNTAVHLALAVDTPRGLLVPVIRDAAALGLLELARQRVDLVDAYPIKSGHPRRAFRWYLHPHQSGHAGH